MRDSAYALLTVGALLGVAAVHLLVKGASNPPGELGMMMAGWATLLGGLVGFVAFAFILAGAARLRHAPPRRPPPGDAGERK